MKALESCTSLSTLYLLAATRGSARWGADRRLQEDVELSRAFADHNRTLLAQYAARPGPPFRIGLVFRAARPRMWGNENAGAGFGFPLQARGDRTVCSNGWPRSDRPRRIQSAGRR